MKCISGIIWRTILPALLLLGACDPVRSPIEEAYGHLDGIRDRKLQELSDHLKSIVHTAQSIRHDSLLTRFFELKNEYYQLTQSVSPPPEAREAVEKLKRAVKRRYMERYLSFYDILCINTDGDIFYTIRKQADYHKNLFGSELRETSLAKRLSTMKSESFVDFQYYDVSGEPSAFFIEPVLMRGELIGWFALQYATNKLNNIMRNSRDLGAGGEVILVNKDRYLLTDSRFKPRSSILKQQLSRENIEDKFRVGTGRKSVVDYRGFRVLSSFGVCSVMGSEWLLIVKMNEAEAVTNYYRKHKQPLRQYLVSTADSVVPVRAAVQSFVSKDTVEVDMDEFRRIDSGSIIFTHGITTCTGISISMPGKFCYLSHMSNLDVCAGGTKMDLVGTIMNRIRYLEVLPCDLPKLRVVVAAPHQETVGAIIDALVEQGLSLSQIRFAYRPGNVYADLYHECGREAVIVRWGDRNGDNAPVRQNAEDFQTMECLYRNCFRHPF